VRTHRPMKYAIGMINGGPSKIPIRSHVPTSFLQDHGDVRFVVANALLGSTNLVRESKRRSASTDFEFLEIRTAREICAVPDRFQDGLDAVVDYSSSVTR
jgi:hypothetical protein